MSKKYMIVGLLAVVSVLIIFLFDSRIRSEEIKPIIGPSKFEKLGDDNRMRYGKYIETCDSYSRQGRHEEVVELANKAVAIAPDEPQAYNFLCVSYAALRNYSEAIRVSEKYMQILKSRNLTSKDAVIRHADFLLKGLGREEAIRFLQLHGEIFSGRELDMYIQILKSS